MSHASEPLPADETECYHCGLPIPPDSNHYVRVDGRPRRMCCAGCEAVAESIVSSGLTEYYRHRDAMPESRREALPVELEQLGLFDNSDFQKSFVRPVGEHEREASLILEGITCAACVWLNEQHIIRQPGVLAADINYATRRARVRWDERQIQLSTILAAIQAIGYRAYPYDAERSEQVAARERRSALWRLFVAGFGMMQVMMYAIPAYLAGKGDVMSFETSQLLRWASLVLTLPVVLYAAAPFFQRALRDVKLRRLGMDVPVALGVGTAFAASCWATFTGTGEVYFDSVAMFVFFLLCGRYLEMLARQRAVRGVEELGKVLPAFAERFTAWPGGEVEQVAVSVLAPGDVVRVKPGESIPADAVVVDGESAANEALLTGESRPVAKHAGCSVIGGTINIASPLVLRIEQVGDSTRLAAIQRLMERSAAEKPRVVQLADRVAAWFVAVLLVLAVATALGWAMRDPAAALWVFVSVLVVSCPCALSLATPVALTVGTDRLARLGVLVTRGHAIETLARATHFVFDKTGTLTSGEMRLTRTWVSTGLEVEPALRLAVALEGASEHAIARGLRAAGEAEGAGVGNLRAVTGRGIEGEVDGRRLRLGQESFVAELVGVAPPGGRPDFPPTATVVALGAAGAWLAWFCLEDELRPEAEALISLLKRAGKQLAILSGDSSEAVAGLAARLGIEDARGALLPEGKQAYLATLQQQPDAVVAMVGDGVNDAPVLAQAHVSVAMGRGTELARTQGDIVLLNDNLASLGSGLAVAKRTMRVTRENLWWAFAYNIVAVPLAMAGMVTPWMAGIGMASSSLLVVLNALRLQRPIR